MSIFILLSDHTTCIGSCIRLGIKLDSAKGCFQKRKTFQISGSEPLDNGWNSLRSYIVSYSISHGRYQLVIQPIIHISFAHIHLPTQLMCLDKSWESLCYQRSRSLAFQALQCCKIIATIQILRKGLCLDPICSWLSSRANMRDSKITSVLLWSQALSALRCAFTFTLEWSRQFTLGIMWRIFHGPIDNLSFDSCCVLQTCSQLPYRLKRSQEFLHNVWCGITEQCLSQTNSFRHFSNNEMSTLPNHSLSFRFISCIKYEWLYHSTLMPVRCTKSFPWHRAHFKQVADIVTLHADGKYLAFMQIVLFARQFCHSILFQNTMGVSHFA